MSLESEAIIGIYRRHAQTWARLRRQDLFERNWLDRFLALLPEAPSVLDVGCGSGDPIGRHLVTQGCHVTGIDSSPELIEIAKTRVPEGDWLVADMRSLELDREFDAILAWDSSFHLTPENQHRLFPVFRRHAKNGAALMFTSGPRHGEAIGEFEGEALYHASLDRDTYRKLLDRNDFDVAEHVIEDPECGGHTVWLARCRKTL